jgi:hypothetical protein
MPNNNKKPARNAFSNVKLSVTLNFKTLLILDVISYIFLLYTSRVVSSSLIDDLLSYFPEPFFYYLNIVLALINILFFIRIVYKSTKISIKLFSILLIILSIIAVLFFSFCAYMYNAFVIPW